ncbi:MAG: phosphodiesterase [Magnetococcales bacterium]|nr:phosphodiesterase [Magnetococcales bacterium]
MLSLLHFSDCHLLADPQGTLYGAQPAHCLEQLLQAAHPWAQACQLAIVTGDLTQHGEPEAYQRAEQMFQRLGCPVYTLPGNHDRPEIMQEQLSGQPIRWQSSLTEGGWQMLFLNSLLPEQTEGYLDASALQQLQQQLQNGPDLPALLALHHQPVAVGTPWMDQIGLSNPEALFALLQHHPRVRLILFGHIHQPLDTVQQSIRLLGTPSTCVQFVQGTAEPEFILDQPAFRWLRLHDDGSIETKVIPCSIAKG